jgi:hypothetical protein
MTIKKHAQELRSIEPPKDDFGILVECEDGVYFINFIFLDLYAQTVQKLSSIEYHCNYARIRVNQADPTEFALHLFDAVFAIQLCKVVKTDIILGDVINRLFDWPHFYDGRIYGFSWIQDDEGMTVRDLSDFLFKLTRFLRWFKFLCIISSTRLRRRSSWICRQVTIVTM